MKKLFMRYLLMPLLLLLTFGFIQQPTEGYAVGDMVSEFKLRNVDGKMISLTDYNGYKGCIVIFTCNSCPFAQAYEDRILSLHQRYAAMGYPVIAINPNDATREPEDSYENMQKRASAKKYPFVYLYDETQQVAKTFGAKRTPHVFLLKKTEKGHKVIYIGAIDDNFEDPSAVKERYLENAISQSDAGKPVTVNSTKAIGCGIKWKKF